MKKAAVFLLVFLAVFLSGCTVTPQQYVWCHKRCEPNGGLEYYGVWRRGPFIRHCSCNNGAIFRRTSED